MKYYSIKSNSQPVSFTDAVKTNMSPDGGLYMPESIPELKTNFLNALHTIPLHELSYETLLPFVSESLSKNILAEIIEKAFIFDAPLVKLSPSLYILELFHGPTAAFKDFGVRFLAELLSYLQQFEQTERTIITATSGDTGAAVADAFYNKDGISAYILYPQGKVSKVQELQIAALGGNIKAIEVEGTFDDCQRLVKWACTDQDIILQKNLCSANSINIARLLPQVCYYLRGWAQVEKRSVKPIFSVPSGNFGNLTAGMIAKSMGMPCDKMIAATNANDTITRFLNTGQYRPTKPIETISNAMDIADPNNFPRVQHLTKNSFEELKNVIQTYSFSDKETYHGIGELYEKYSYISDPHTAVGYLGSKNSKSELKICLGTAHPIKFTDTVEKVLETRVDIPESMKGLFNKTKCSIPMKANNLLLKQIILG